MAANNNNSNNAKFVTLLDPAYRAGLLQIPVERTMPTKGRDEWLRGTLRKDLSLCCLFQKGRCHADDRCHQVHVERAYMEALRAQQAKIISCCRACNDTASLAPQALNFFASQFVNVSAVHVSTLDAPEMVNDIGAERLALTTGLTSFMEGIANVPRTLTIPGKKVCRLHLRGACKYGKDCKNIHMCSKFGEGILSSGSTSFRRVTTSGASSPTPTPAARMSPAPEMKPATPPPAVGIFDRVANKAPVDVAAPAQATKPMPSFSLFASEPRAPSEPATSLHLSCSDAHVDPIDVNESSGRLSGIVFDPVKALEESQRGRGTWDFNSTGSSWANAISPGQKRRGSGSSSQGASATSSAEATLASTPEWNPFQQSTTSGATAVNQGFLRMFA